MHDPQSEALAAGVRQLRHGVHLARDVLAGTDGDPVAAARTLAELVQAIGESVAGGLAHPHVVAFVPQVAPMMLGARLTHPEMFEEVCGLLEDIGAPPLLRDLPTSWTPPPWGGEPGAGTPGDAAEAFGLRLGYEIGDAARERVLNRVEQDPVSNLVETMTAEGLLVEPAAAEREVGNDDADPIELSRIVQTVLVTRGLTASLDDAHAVADAVMTALGYVGVDEPAIISSDPLPPQCAAILPADRSGRVNDGWLHCSLPPGHAEPHRTCYTGPAAAVGDPGWTFDRAAIQRLPSAYMTPGHVRTHPVEPGAVQVVEVHATPWMLDFQPVPTALHRDTVPDDVRVRYATSLQSMIAALELHPSAIVHAIFVTDQRLREMTREVFLIDADVARLAQAWANHPDPHGWGPGPDRQTAVWYPVARSISNAVAGPF